MYYVIY